MSIENINEEITPDTSEVLEQPQSPETVQSSTGQEVVLPAETTSTPEYILCGPPLVTLTEDEIAEVSQLLSSDEPPDDMLLHIRQFKAPSLTVHMPIVHTPSGDKLLLDVFKEMIECEQKEQTHEYYPWNDIGIGNLFADTYKNRLKFVKEERKWYMYHDGKWGEDNDGAMNLCTNLVQSLQTYANEMFKINGSASQHINRIVKKLQDQKNRKNILSEASNVNSIRISIKEFDKDPFLLNCRNGTLELDMKTGEVRKRDYNPEDLLTQMANVEYDPDAECPLWQEHIKKVMSDPQPDGSLKPNSAKAMFLQQAMGYALTGSTKFECLFILNGRKSRNGKGTTMETLVDLMGDYARKANPSTIEEKSRNDGSGPSEDVARLKGARFVSISEPDRKLVLSSAKIKSLTGGDTQTVRHLYQESFQYTPHFKIFVDTNYLPTITDPTVFMSGRIKVIQFNVFLGKEGEEGDAKRDEGMKEKLKSEQSGILNWCLEGLRQFSLNDGKFVKCDAVEEAHQLYRDENDTVGGFVEDVLEESFGDEIVTKTVYEQYRKWCKRNAVYSDSLIEFRKKILVYAEIKRKRPDAHPRANPVSMILGYKFKRKVKEELEEETED